MCTCLEQELDDAAESGLVDKKRCHHVVHRRKGHRQTHGFLQTNSVDKPLALDAAGRADESDQKSEQWSHR